MPFDLVAKKLLRYSFHIADGQYNGRLGVHTARKQNGQPRGGGLAVTSTMRKAGNVGPVREEQTADLEQRDLRNGDPICRCY